MIVPNYVPDPLEVPGNVTLERYRVRIEFVRRVVRRSALSFTAITCSTLLAIPILPLVQVAVALMVSILMLSIERLINRSRPADVWGSLAIFPLAAASLALFMKALAVSGIPIYGPMIGILCAWIYTELCGRDFSFVGQFVLSLIVSSGVIALLALSVLETPKHAWILLLSNLVALSYYVYDCASLMSRRRVGEELAAMCDLYRDVLNIFGYIPRVISHWRKHKIFAVPTKYSRQ